MPFNSKILIERALGKKVRLDVNCGEEFDVSVEYSLEVRQCGDPTDDEQERMVTGLSREMKRKTEEVCDALDACPFTEVVNIQELSNRCEDSIWTITWAVKAKCVQ